MTSAKVITFWAPTAGTGVTLTGINVARRMIEKGLKTLVLDFDLPNPTTHFYFQNFNTVRGLDNLLPHASSGQLTPDVLESQLLEQDGIFYLKGSNVPEKSHYIQPEQLEAIMNVARTLFDYIVIDTNGIIDHAGSFVGLNQADAVMVVLEKNVLPLQKYHGIRSLLEEHFDMSKFHLVINKSNKEIGMDVEDIQQFVSLQSVFELPDLGVQFINSLNQGKWLDFLSGASKQSKAYEEAADLLIETAIVQDFANMKSVKRSPFAKLFRK